MNGTHREVAGVGRLTRPEAIDLLRKKLQSFTDADHCLCAAATRAGVFCRGFARLSDEEFRRRFHWITSKRPRASRKELEEIVNQYHLGRQEATGAAICCDVETKEHTGCDGWNTFDNTTLETLCCELLGRVVQVG